MDRMLEGTGNIKEMGDILMRELLAKLRNNKGLFCMVTKSTARNNLPSEFNLMINLEHPSEESQLKYWESLLGNMPEEFEQRMVQLVEDYPLHLSEIDYIARQAGILATIRRMDAQPTLDELSEVITGYRQKQHTPLLFGGDR
jgi:hypothetical protein